MIRKYGYYIAAALSCVPLIVYVIELFTLSASEGVWRWWHYIGLIALQVMVIAIMLVAGVERSKRV